MIIEEAFFRLPVTISRAARAAGPPSSKPAAPPADSAPSADEGKDWWEGLVVGQFAMAITQVMDSWQIPFAARRVELERRYPTSTRGPACRGDIHVDLRNEGNLRDVFGTYGISPSNWIEVKALTRRPPRDRYWAVLPDMVKLGHLAGSDGRYLAIVSPHSMSGGRSNTAEDNKILELDGVFKGAPNFEVSLDLARSAEDVWSRVCRIVKPYGVRTGATRFRVEGRRYEIEPQSGSGLWFYLLHLKAASLT